MALKPVKLEIEGFRSFKNRSSLEFPQSGLTLISGKWDNGDVSSGSGKSAIFMAIAYALDVCDIAATDLKNYDSKKKFVQLTLSDSTNTYVITRDPKITLSINGVNYEGLAKGAKEKIYEILGISPDLVKDLTYREQRTRGKFVNSTDSQKKEFLSELLGLIAFEKASDDYVKEISALQSSIQILNNDVNNAKNNLQMVEITQEEIDKAQQAVTQAEQKVCDCQDANRAGALTIQANEAAESIRQAYKIASEIRTISSNRETLKATIISLKQEIDTLRQCVCPTCNREWNAHQEVLSAKELKFKDLLAQFEQSGMFITQKQPIVDQIPAMEEQKNSILAQIFALKSPLQDAQNICSMAKQTLNLLLSRKASKDQTLKALQSKTSELEQKQKRLQVLEHCSKIVGRNGFMGSIFDEVLSEIESRTNDMIGYLPNISQYTISLSSTTVTKTTGTAKKEISTKIYKHGKESSYKSLSGGQQVALELCADLAYAETIRNRSGNILGWVCLDEAMEGFGVEEKQAAIDMIKQKVKGLVLIIDHSTEIKEGFEKVIEIRYNGKESSVLHAT